MGWRKPTEDDVVATLSGREVEAFRASADFAADPVDILLARTVAMVRGYIAANGRTRMGPAGTIPEMLVSPAMDYLALDILKRMKVAPGEARAKAREKAEELFKEIARGALNVEGYAQEDADAPLADDRKAVTPATSKARVPGVLD